MVQIQLEKAPPVAEGPLEHLVACHRRIEDRLDVLERAGAMLDSAPEASLIAIQNSIRFMDLSGALHTIDEEESVFPRLREAVSAEEREYLHHLEAEHCEAEQVYARLKAVAERLRQHVTSNDVAEYRGTVATLVRMYRSHIASEDSVLVQMGRRSLTDEQLETIQSEMRARRR
jgi:hemerythrin-like domain-containing protein